MKFTIVSTATFFYAASLAAALPGLPLGGVVGGVLGGVGGVTVSTHLSRALMCEPIADLPSLSAPHGRRWRHHHSPHWRRRRIHHPGRKLQHRPRPMLQHRPEGFSPFLRCPARPARHRPPGPRRPRRDYMLPSVRHWHWKRWL